MALVKTDLKGIVRNIPGNESADGCCNEVINIRKKDGVLRPVGNKAFFGNLEPNKSLAIIHEVGNLKKIIDYNKVTGNMTAWETDETVFTFLANIGPEKDIDLQVMGNTVIIVNRTDIKLQYLRYIKGAYSFISLPKPPVIKFTNVGVSNKIMTGTINLSGLSNLEMQIYMQSYLDKNLGEWEKAGVFEGFVSLIYAYELMDSSYIYPSAPQMLYVGNPDYVYVGGYWDTPNAPWGEFTAGKIQFKTFSNNSDPYPDLTPYQDIIKGIAVFMTYPEHWHRGPESKEVVSALTAKFRYKNDLAKPSEVIKKNLYYKVLSWSTDKIKESITFGGNTLYIHDLPIKISDLKTADTYPVDSFSHHDLVGNCSSIYNSRLTLGDTINKLYTGPSPKEFFGTTIINGTQYCLEWEIKTSEGIRIVRSEVFNRPTSTITWPVVISYPDSRASKFRLLYNNGVWGTAYEYSLTPHDLHNFSYYVKNEQYLPQIVDVNLILPSEPPPLNNNQINDIINDKNRVQFSEAGNPFLYPVKNSNQVGSGHIIDITTNSDPISQGQFGQYPILVFANNGMWAMQLSTGDTYVTNVVPFNGEILRSRGAYFNNGNFITFIDHENQVKILSGKDAINISDPIYYKPDTNLIDLPNYNIAINNIQTVQLKSIVSTKDGKDYLKDAIIAYNREESEIILSNALFNYSYVYHMKSKFWYKLAEAYRLFINDYPRILAVNKDIEIRDLNLEEYYYSNYKSDNIPAFKEIYIESMPFKFGTNGHKKIDRFILNCQINLSSSGVFGAYVYGSNDGINYHFLTGKQGTGVFNDLTGQIKMLGMKYYKFIISGHVSIESYISEITCDVEGDILDKIR